MKHLLLLCKIDPHTAVAWQAAQNYRENTSDKDTPMIVLSTASPYKFNESVLAAIDASNLCLDADDEFSLLDKLKKFNKYAIPSGLASLKSAPILHKKVCCKENMSAEIENYLKI